MVGFSVLLLLLQSPKAPLRYLRVLLGSDKPLAVFEEALKRGEGLLWTVPAPPGRATGLAARVVVRLGGWRPDFRRRRRRHWGRARGRGSVDGVRGPPLFLARSREAFRDEVFAKPCRGVQSGLEDVPPELSPAPVDVADSDRPRSLQNRTDTKKERVCLKAASQVRAGGAVAGTTLKGGGFLSRERGSKYAWVGSKNCEARENYCTWT